MSKKSYADKLKDPRWQKKRLEILSRDEWMCKKCQSEDATLHVHHRYYDKDLEPWEYPDFALASLCEVCHKEEKDDYKVNGELLINTLKMKGFWGNNLSVLCDAFQELPVDLPPEVIVDIICYSFRTERIVKMLVEEYFSYLVSEK